MRYLFLAIMLCGSMSAATAAEKNNDKQTIERAQHADDYRALGAEVRSPGGLGRQGAMEVSRDNRMKEREKAKDKN